MNNEKTEWCSECDREVTLNWDIEKDGYCCYCPYCGKRLMLCQYCDGAADGECDWKENGGCKHSPENESRKENEMTKTEIENKIYDLKRVIESYKNIIKANENEIKKLEAEKEKPAFERVERGKKYYFVDVYRGKYFAKYEVDEHSILDDEIYASNNYFHTRERAEEVADKINFLLKLERLHDIYCPDYEPDWNDRIKTKWNVVFDYDEKEYVSYWNAVVDSHTTVYFDSKKTADKVCDILNKELENEDM
jgi:hypothetical protein